MGNRNIRKARMMNEQAEEVPQGSHEQIVVFLHPRSSE